MKNLKKLELVKKSVVELGNKQLKELRGGSDEFGGTGCKPANMSGTQKSGCFTHSCC